MERHSGTYGWVFGQIRVDPNDENTVYTMGVPLSVSNDGGKTFQPRRGARVDHHAPVDRPGEFQLHGQGLRPGAGRFL